jgi:hypothetical protein
VNRPWAIASATFCAASAVGGLPIVHGRISQVQIGMLGPFEVRTDDGVFADVPGARLRGLLIALALKPGRAVPKATLVDWIWGEQPPLRSGLQRLVSRLRKALMDLPGRFSNLTGQFERIQHAVAVINAST